MKEHTAKFVKDVSKKFAGMASVYKVSPPVDYGWDFEKEIRTGTAEFVVASAVVVNSFFGGGGPEVFLFPCDEDGNVLSWGELSGSQQGTLDIDAVMRAEFNVED